MKLINSTELEDFKEKNNGLIHPYELLENEFRPFEEEIDRLFADELINEKKRAIEIDIPRFYSFITEMRVAIFLRNKVEKLSFSEDGGNAAPSPDFNADGVFIEVNLPSKSSPFIAVLSQNLRKINRFFQFFKPPFSKLPIILDIHECHELYLEISHNLTSKKTPKIGQEIVYEDRNKYIRCGLAQGWSDFVYGSGVDVLQNLLKDSICNKIKSCSSSGIKLKNDLNAKRPNLLWSEFGFLSDFTIAIDDAEAFPAIKDLLKNRSLPKDLDAHIVSICSLTDFYDKQNSLYKPKFLLFVNDQSHHKRQILKFIRKIFPKKSVRVFCCKEVWESHLDMVY